MVTRRRDAARLTEENAWRGIRVRDLSFTYADGSRALVGVALDIPVGRRFAVVGPHACGKTTLLEVLAGRRTRYDGEVAVDGVLVTKRERRRLRERMALVAEDAKPTLFVRTVWEYVTAPLLRSRLPKAEVIRRAEVALAMVGMQAARDERLAALHHWQRRRVALAVAAATRPQFLLLDEPTCGLDPQAVNELSHLLQALQWLGTTVVVATHDVDFAAAWSDTVALLCDGRVLAMGDGQLLVDRELMERANLRLPLLSMPFALLPGRSAPPPRTLADAVRELWRLSSTWEGVV